ncbi:MAG: lysophospholipid acyltransferase family protein [Gammaproteobacteria bacterium]
MLARLDYWRRALGNGLCIVVYGGLSLLASFTLLPLLQHWPGNVTARQRRVRRVVSGSFRMLLVGVTGLGLGRVEVQGREWLEHARGKLLIATHPMYLDVVALLALLPQADCVVKGAMLRNPLYRRFVTAAGYISNADPARLIEDCVLALQHGRTLVVFPEGTRSEPGQARHFRRGAAQVAVRSGCQILPVLIRCDPPALLKSTRWHQVTSRPWRLLVKFYPPQAPDALGVQPGLPHAVAARRLNRNLEKFFKQQLAAHEQPDRRTEAAHHHLARS